MRAASPSGSTGCAARGGIVAKSTESLVEAETPSAGAARGHRSMGGKRSQKQTKGIAEAGFLTADYTDEGGSGFRRRGASWREKSPFGFTPNVQRRRAGIASWRGNSPFGFAPDVQRRRAGILPAGSRGFQPRVDGRLSHRC